MSEYWNIIKKNWKLLVVLTVLFALALFLFLPRNLGTLCEITERTITEITLHGMFIDENEPHISVPLTEEQQEELLEMLKTTYVFRNPIAKPYSHGGDDYVGYLFELVSAEDYEDGSPLVEYFTRNIISVNGIQYRFYGNGFEEWFEAFME